MRKSAAMKKLEAYFKGLYAEFGEPITEYEFGWFAAQFGVAKSELTSCSERSGWQDFMYDTF